MTHVAAGLIRNVLGVAGHAEGLKIAKASSAPVEVAVIGASLDSAKSVDENDKGNHITEDGETLDDVADDATSPAQYADANIRLRVAATIQQWCETDDLQGDETLSDRLCGMFIGIADQDKDGELDEAETVVVTAVLEAAWDYLLSKGVSDEDCSLLLNDWDSDAGNRVSDVVASSLPDGDDAADADIDGFAFGDGDQEATFDAVYKKTMVIRHGKKVRINKRMSGHVRLSSAQKVGIRKAQMKSHSARAVMRRLKSRMIGKKMGL